MITVMRRYRKSLQLGLLVVIAAFVASLFVLGTTGSRDGADAHLLRSYGSAATRVRQLCALESFATVHHLVSTVSGRLRPDRDRVDLLAALFPAGSMTGAPKVRAMEVIDELEGEERGIYSGSVGYLSLDGALDFNIVIRTIVCSGGRAHLRVGGGIVADSDPREEYRETLDKAKALLDVLGAGPDLE